jgi:hypothetical protein
MQVYYTLDRALCNLYSMGDMSEIICYLMLLYSGFIFTIADVWIMETRVSLDRSELVAILGLASRRSTIGLECLDHMPHRISLKKGDVFVQKAWGKNPTVRHTGKILYVMCTRNSLYRHFWHFSCYLI